MLINDDVIKAADLIRKVYEFSPVGGNLHVYLDDGNLEDHLFNGDPEPPFLDTSVEQRLAEAACWESLKRLSETERHRACGLAMSQIPLD